MKTPTDLLCPGDEPRWRGVLLGLRILLAAWLAVPAAVVLVIAVVAITVLLQEDHRWVGPVGRWTVTGGFLIVLASVAVGVGYCCRVPPESGARMPLFFAIGLVVLGGTSLLVWQFVDSQLIVLSPRRHSPGLHRVGLAVTGLGVSSLSAAVLSWLLFLRAIAQALSAERLAGEFRIYLVVFAVWAGIAIASGWLLHVQERENLALTLVAAVNMMLGFGHAIWIVGLQTALADAIGAAVRAHERALVDEEAEAKDMTPYSMR